MPTTTLTTSACRRAAAHSAFGSLRRGVGLGLAAAFVLALPAIAAAQPSLQISITDPEGPSQVVPTLKILGLLTILSIAPGILVTMTSFTRMVVVLSFTRQALGTQTVPPMQVLLALSLLLTFVTMAPVARRMDAEALTPYVEERIDEGELYDRTAAIVREFLLPQTRESDLLAFYDLSQTERPTTPEEVDLSMLVPAFVVSELRTGFEMGFLIFLPFVLVDLVVASILTAMGMVMLPPTMISAPLKVLLFVVVDGWSLLTQSLVASFGGGP